MNTTMSTLRPQLDRARRAWRASPMPRFFDWWGGELVGMLPTAWRVALAGGAQWFLLERGAEQWSLRRSGEAEPRARWPADAEAALEQAAIAAAVQDVEREDLRLALLLPPASALRRRLLLPLAAADNLQQVGAFEMDRQTPFQAAQVYYAMTELPLPAPAGRFFAELVAVPRERLDPLLGELEAGGVRVDAVDVADGQGRLGVNLLPAGRGIRRAYPRQRLNLALGLACGVLLLLALGQWLHNRRVALEAMQNQVQSMQREAQQVASLRQQLQDNAGAASFLVQRRLRRPTVLDLLRDLTVRFPESAWMERMSLDTNGQIGFQGQAVQAAGLIDLLKRSPLLKDPNFQGSIQPDPATGKERFYMVAQMQERAPGKAAPAAGAKP